MTESPEVGVSNREIALKQRIRAFLEQHPAP